MNMPDHIENQSQENSDGESILDMVNRLIRLKQETAEEIQEETEPENYLQQILNLLKEQARSIDYEKKLEELLDDYLNNSDNEYSSYYIEYIWDELLDGGMTEDEVQCAFDELLSKSLPGIFEEYVSNMSVHEGYSLSLEDLIKLKKYLSENHIELPVDTLTNTGISLLHIAVAMGDEQLVDILIERGANLRSNGNGTIVEPIALTVYPSSEAVDLVKRKIANALNRLNL
ncbi:MAG: hypothetical protein ACO30P_04175 [Candidatus Kapaibacteriota bacterium]